MDRCFMTKYEKFEEDLIFNSLVELKGNKMHVAKDLGLSIRTIRNKVQKYPRLVQWKADGRKRDEPLDYFGRPKYLVRDRQIKKIVESDEEPF